MRIISKFKDYYDGVQSYGHGDDLTFVRNQRVIPFFTKDKEEQSLIKSLKGLGSLNMPKPPNFGSSNSSSTTFIIAFCGKKYMGYKIEGNVYYSLTSFFDAVDAGTSYSNIDCISEDLDIKIKEERLKKHRDFVKQARSYDEVGYSDFRRFNKKFPLLGHESYRFTELCWNTWAKNNKEPSKVPESTFRNANTPIIVYEEGKRYILNPALKDYEFGKIMDPYTAYQEIDMYLGNNMVDQFDPSVNRTDIEIRDSKGMDDWSFKTPSPGNKSRKQK